MPINSLADLNSAYKDGRYHVQRILKNAGSSYDLQWADATFASGQPAYDAHVGSPLEFTPCVAIKNDAVWFPGISAGQSRYLHSVTMQSFENTTNLVPPTMVLFDLVGFYPLIDGDSVDQQDLDNTITIPRYASGEGVQIVLVNHVAPALAAAVATVNYTNHLGEEKVTSFSVALLGQNMVCSVSRTVAGSYYGNIGVALANGDKGVRSVNSITFNVAPGGLFCLYLIKPIGIKLQGDNGIPAEKDYFLHHGFRMPVIPDGAWISWLSRIGSGTSRSVSWFGDFTFVWA